MIYEANKEMVSEEITKSAWHSMVTLIIKTYQTLVQC